METRSYVRGLFFALFATSAVACAPTTRTSETSLTAAEMAREDAPAAPPAGELVCRASSVAEGKAELYVDWKASKGTLRRVTPSGMTSDTVINVERYKGMIVADDVHSTDLVMHAAVVREHNGKPHIRLDSAAWLSCQ